ncbi:hypothetical protein J421_2744 [Gemmatirosa kalamazoonensis]|uniref:DZANK-type domain-containing protein n=1 Tax=Gemmatirosa kalamazoonensis TaxID=861299 RepID=W0RHP0_9BACT|nr:zinc ribbon domain-containing protein [Gemmatirosa kalamazoonensis]AHG90281.1 hypothetical protein J421_2744 [Gemmatirosa kalamazoonensis]
MALPDGVIALGAGTVLALGAAALVLGPLLRDETDAPRARRPVPSRAREATTGAVDALREIEFDRATGKLSDADYDALKATYTREALAELRARDAAAALGTRAAAAASDDIVERTIRRYRASSAHAAVCPVDGPRPEADAVFCSACGRYLPAVCPRCGAACDQPEQRFCGACGVPLDAAAA